MQRRGQAAHAHQHRVRLVLALGDPFAAQPLLPIWRICDERCWSSPCWPEILRSVHAVLATRNPI